MYVKVKFWLDLFKNVIFGWLGFGYMVLDFWIFKMVFNISCFFRNK